MQPLRKLRETLQSLADRDHYLFTGSDLAAVVPECRQMPVLLSRGVKAGILRRVCKGIFLYPVHGLNNGHLLFHAAARLRAGEFNYISSGNRTQRCWVDFAGAYQLDHSHEFWQEPYRELRGFWPYRVYPHRATSSSLADQLSYDVDRHLWRASVPLALRDMKATRRSLDLVDQTALHELV
jgi:hypothetical protein